MTQYDTKIGGVNSMKKELKVFYQSTIRGITERDTGCPVLYLGYIVRTPKMDFPEKLLENEPNIKEVIENLERESEVEYIPGGIIERYEVRELESNDMVAMWRIPVRPKLLDTQAREMCTFD